MSGWFRKLGTLFTRSRSAPAAPQAAAPETRETWLPEDAVVPTRAGTAADPWAPQVSATPDVDVPGSAAPTQTAARVDRPIPPPPPVSVQPARTSVAPRPLPPAPARATAPTPKPVPLVVEFKAGDHVEYPTHGAGQVQSIEDMPVAGFSLKVIVVTFEESRTTLRIPVNKAGSCGLRKVALAPAATPRHAKAKLESAAPVAQPPEVAGKAARPIRGATESHPATSSRKIAVVNGASADRTSPQPSPLKVARPTRGSISNSLRLPEATQPAPPRPSGMARAPTPYPAPIERSTHKPRLGAAISVTTDMGGHGTASKPHLPRPEEPSSTSPGINTAAIPAAQQPVPTALAISVSRRAEPPVLTPPPTGESEGLLTAASDRVAVVASTAVQPAAPPAGPHSSNSEQVEESNRDGRLMPSVVRDLQFGAAGTDEVDGGPPVASEGDDGGWDIPIAESMAEPSKRKGPDEVAADPFEDPALSGPGLDLPDYDENLSQRLGSEVWAKQFPDAARARERAAQILALMDFPTRTDQVAALAWLEDFFTRRPAAATFRAIERAALGGLDWPTIRAMDALREVWEERPEWWVCRVVRPGTGNGFATTARLANGPTALTWTMARRICEARAHFPPESMIDPDWLADWHGLPREGPSAISFAEYAAQRVAEEPTRRLEEGFRLREAANDPTEHTDRHDWHRGLRDPADGLPLSLRMIDPAERRMDRGAPG